MQKYLSKPKKRKPSSHRNQQLHPTLSERRASKNNGVVLVAVILMALFGAGIALFIVGESVIWLFTGAILGGIAGYFFGLQIVKGLSKR